MNRVTLSADRGSGRRCCTGLTTAETLSVAVYIKTTGREMAHSFPEGSDPHARVGLLVGYSEALRGIQLTGHGVGYCGIRESGLIIGPQA